MNSAGFARVLLGFAGLLAGVRPALAANFAADTKAWSDDHAAVFEQADKLSSDGYPTDGNQILIAVSEEDTSPVAAFVLANKLYSFDPAASYRLHLRALQGFPDEPTANLEAAMEHHRRGEYPAAIIDYRFALGAGAPRQFQALLADCLVRTGQPGPALQAWNQADAADHRSDVDYAICSIYGPLSPVQRRGDLIAKIEAGDTARMADLILLDLAFDTDWWTAKINDDAVDHDLQRALQLFGHKNGRYQALAIYAKLTRSTDKRQSEIHKALTDAHLVIGPDAVLPDNSQIARALCELAVTAHLISPADLWSRYEMALRSRLEHEDRDALHLLCWLAAANRNPRLTQLDQQGWEDWNDPAFAASYMVDLFREKKLTSPTDSQLLAAMAIAPDNATLANLRIALAGDNVTNDLLVAAIKAEFRKLSPGETQRDSTRLSALFDALGKRL